MTRRDMLLAPGHLANTLTIMIRRLGTVSVLAAAVGGPYVASETDWGRTVTSQTAKIIQTGAGYSADSAAGLNAGVGTHAHHEIEALRDTHSDRFRYDEQMVEKLDPQAKQIRAEQSLVGPNVADLREVLRFDVSSQWVTGRFSRVSTVLSDLRLQGFRVPLVTGTRADDIAGTLTYYFDHSGQVQRITMHGFTGDPGRLVQTMTQFYGLTGEPSLEAGAYTRRWNGKPVHFLRLSHAPVVYADAVHQKFTVFLELNQPNLAFGISEEANEIVIADRHSGRW